MNSISRGLPGRCAAALLLVGLPAAAWPAAPESISSAAEGSEEAPLLLDLGAAINLALEQNHTLMRSRLGVDAASAALAGERAEFSFRLEPGGSASTSSTIDSYEAGLRLARRAPIGTEVAVRGSIARDAPELGEPLERAGVRVTVSQPLLRRFGTLVNLDPVESARLNVTASLRRLQQQKADLVFEVVRTYEDVLRLEGQVAAEIAFFGQMDRLYRLARARERQGRARRVDTLRLELQRGESKARLQRAREELAARSDDLADLLGQPPGTRYALAEPPQVVLDLAPSAESVDVALTHRMDYAQALEDYADSARGIAVARRALWPDLSLFARYERNEWNAPEGVAPDEDTYAIGLAGGSDLLAARQRANVEGAIVDRESLYQQVLILQSVIAREVGREQRAYVRAGRELEIARDNLSFARDRARLSQRLFEAGRGDPFTASDAAEAFQSAERRMLAARAEASVAAYRLLRALGTLVEYPADLLPAREIAR